MFFVIDSTFPYAQLSRQQWEDVQIYARSQFFPEHSFQESQLGRLYLPLFSSDKSDSLTLEGFNLDALINQSLSPTN